MQFLKPYSGFPVAHLVEYLLAGFGRFVEMKWYIDRRYGG